MVAQHTPSRGLPVIVQNRDVLEAIAGMVKPTGTIVFAGQPTDAQIVTISGTIFEFDDDSSITAGRTSVTIGGTAEATRDNLLAAIQLMVVGTSDVLLFTATASSTDTILLTYYQVGTAGNVTITENADNVTVTGLSGGTDGGVVNVLVSGLTFDKDIDIGDLHLLNIANSKIDPATEGKQDAVITAVKAATHGNKTLLFARIDDDTITGGTYSAVVAAAVGSKKIYVVELLLMVDAQCELEWVEDPQGTPSVMTKAPPMFFAQRGALYLPRDPGYRFVTDTVNKALGLDEVANGTVKVRGYLYYYTEA